MHTPDDLRYDLALIGAQAKFFNDIYSTLQDRSDSDFVTDAPF